MWSTIGTIEHSLGSGLFLNAITTCSATPIQRRAGPIEEKISLLSATVILIVNVAAGLTGARPADGP
jgi:hypothetical protein